ncbi:MAG: GNAT family N-acetyltransferase [Bacteroidaceae bacterium]|jgi:ribosomal protein S18 acetylase RimI-like enzyme
MSITKCKNEEDLLRVKVYLGSDYLKVPYLYTNLYKYGTGNTNVEVWFDINEEQMRGIYLRYFNCLHFYTKETNYSQKSFLEFTGQINPEVIMTEAAFGGRIRPFTKSYSLTREYSIRCDPDRAEYSNLAGYAVRQDIEEIAELIMMDRIYQEIYTEESLYNQLIERFDAGYGKCCIIRRDGKIVANYSINGENDKFIFLGSLIVHPDYRNMGFGSILLKHLCKYAQEKDLECLCFIAENNVKSLELHKKNNALPVGMIYKFRKIQV